MFGDLAKPKLKCMGPKHNMTRLNALAPHMEQNRRDFQTVWNYHQYKIDDQKVMVDSRNHGNMKLRQQLAGNRGHNPIQDEVELGIQRQNAVLCEELARITLTQQTNYDFSDEPARNPHHHGTLNYHVRYLDACKIESQNRHMAQRIHNQKSNDIALLGAKQLITYTTTYLSTTTLATMEERFRSPPITHPTNVHSQISKTSKCWGSLTRTHAHAAQPQTKRKH